MATNNLDREIQSRIASFLSELSTLVKQQALESVQDALSEPGASAPRLGRARRVTMRPGRQPRAIAKRAVRGTRIRRSPEMLAELQASVLAHVRSKAGQRLEEIGRALKTDTSVLKRPIAMLLASKKLKTQGQKRGTKYFVR